MIHNTTASQATQDRLHSTKRTSGEVGKLARSTRTVIRRGRLRLGNAEIFPRSDSAKPLVRAIKQGTAFFNLPDMDFGIRDAAFVPFFGTPAATLLAPSRMARALDMGPLRGPWGVARLGAARRRALTAG